MAAKEGISCEGIDLRTSVPWGVDTGSRAVLKTGLLVVSQEAPISAGFASEIGARIQEECFLYLESPIERVCGLDTPYPLAHEKEYMADHLKVYEAIVRSMNY